MFHHGYCPVCGQYGYRPTHLMNCYVEEYGDEYDIDADTATRAAQRLLLTGEPYLCHPEEIDLSRELRDVRDEIDAREKHPYDSERHLHPFRFRDGFDAEEADDGAA